MNARILDYVDFKKVSALLEGFNQSTGFVTALVDLDGNILSQSGWRRICTEYHRQNPESSQKCRVSDTELAGKMRTGQEYHFYQCKNGLIDVAVPLTVRGEHIANLFSGQFLFEKPDLAFFKKLAEEYGFEESAYLKALEEVPVLSKEKVGTVMRFLQNIAQLIIEMTSEKLDLIEMDESRKKAENTLSEMEETIRLNQDFLEKMMKHTRSIFISWDSQFKICAVNETYETLTGRKAGTMIGQPLETIFPKEKAESSMNQLKRIASENLSPPVELEIVCADNSVRIVLLNASNLYAPDGRTVLTSFSRSQDITEHIKLERALEKTSNELRLTLKNMINAFAVWESVFDDNGVYRSFKFSYFNDAYERIAGISLNDVKGKDVFDVWPETEPSWIEVYGNVALTGVSKTFDMYHKPTKGWYHCNAYRPTESKEQVCVIFEDITERKNQEEKLLYLSNHDHLTNLYNRRYFEEALMQSDTPENLPLSIVMSDVNGLKLINDSFGHAVGDDSLKKAAAILRNACREGDIIARLGGDEFAVILRKTDSAQTQKILADIKNLAAQVKIANIGLSISLGYDTKTKAEQSIIETVANAENSMYKHKLAERSSIRSKTIDLIMKTLFEKSSREMLHSQRVSQISEAIAVRMDYNRDEIGQIRLAGLVHDIGKIGVEENILNKNGKLDDAEWIQMKKHPETGWRILGSTSEFSELANLVIAHHEKWDGSGYPNGLKGEEIPIESRIITVADAFDAMTSEREYRKALDKNAAVAEIKRCSGTQFDPRIVEIFINQVLPSNKGFEAG